MFLHPSDFRILFLDFILFNTKPVVFKNVRAEVSLVPVPKADRVTAAYVGKQ